MSIAENLERVRGEITAACARAGRNPDTVTLVAVSKTHPAQAVLEAAARGVQHFGENRVEEGVTKIPQVAAALAAKQPGHPLVWHMIGHVQSRKAKDVPPLFSVVHSVDTVKLAERLAREAAEAGKTLDALLEINISGEASKGGFAASGWQNDAELRARLWDEVKRISALPGLNVRGLMTMAPIVEDMQQARPVFADLARLRTALSESLGLPLPDLSMGMTDDYPVAIEEGATLVRIGRAIFGERERP
jgi:pyridoxal phosphate enzyme (YggS family)